MKRLLLRIGLLVLTCSCQPAESPAHLPGPPQAREDHRPKTEEEIPDQTEAEQMPLKASRRGHEETAMALAMAPLPPDAGQKLVRTAHIRMQVQDYAQSTRAFQEKIKARQAYITDGTEEREGDNLDNNLFIRVDNRHFDALVADLLRESIFLERKHIKVADVTEEYIDHQARLQTRKKVEQRYLELLSRARNVKDVLQVEEQLSSLQEEIESATARLRYLDHQVAYSTINLNYYEKIAPAQAPEDTFVRQVGTALQQGWASTRAAFLALLSLWPFLLAVAAAAIWVLRYRGRRRALPAPQP
jgi:Domain of unknown function (DUF4349)